MTDNRKSILDMSPDELREEINLLRERRVTARQQSIENKPARPSKTKKPKVKAENDDSLGSIFDSIESMDMAAIDLMLNNLGQTDG